MLPLEILEAVSGYLAGPEAQQLMAAAVLAWRRAQAARGQVVRTELAQPLRFASELGLCRRGPPGALAELARRGADWGAVLVMATDSNRPDLAAAAMERGAVPNAMLAARAVDFDDLLLLAVLLDGGAPPGQALTYAAKNGRGAAVAAIAARLPRGAAAEAAAGTAAFAADPHHPDLVRKLLGLAPGQADRLLAHAIDQRKLVAAEWLLSRAAHFDLALAAAAGIGDQRLITRLLELGAADFNAAYARAALGGHWGAMERLRGLGADNLNAALCGAAAGGHMEIAVRLLDAGASDVGWALAYAAGGGRTALVELMLARGAGSAEQAHITSEAARRAVRARSLGALRLLLQHRTPQGGRALDAAQVQRLQRMARELLWPEAAELCGVELAVG